MKNFNIERLVKVIQWDFMNNWRKNLWSYTGIFGGLLLIMIMNQFAFLIKGTAYEQMTPLLMNVVEPSAVLILVFGSMAWAANVTEQMDKKTGFIAISMLPATAAEKFISRIIHPFIIFPVIFVISLFLADAIRYVLALMFFPSEYINFLFFRIMSDICTSPGTLMLNVNVVFLGLFNTSWFVLGGCIWHKKAFIKTLGATVLIWVIISLLTGGAANMGLLHPLVLKLRTVSPDLFVVNNMTEEQMYTMALIGSAVFCTVMAIGTVINLLIGYRIFKRSELVKSHML